MTPCPTSAQVDRNHGTSIAGLIAGVGPFRGMAPGTAIYHARAFEGGKSTMDVILDALDWAAGQAVRVVNMSFVGPDNDLLKSACANARVRGLVLVAAAGNNGPKAPYGYPAAYPGVIAVTATDADDRLMPQANRGPYVFVSAPGVDMLAPIDGGTDAVTGTSFAAAIVSGAIANLLHDNPDRSADWIEKALAETVVRSRRRRAATRTSATASSTPSRPRHRQIAGLRGRRRRDHTGAPAIEPRTTRSTGQSSPRGAALQPRHARRQPLGDALRRRRGSTSASSSAAPESSPASDSGRRRHGRSARGRREWSRPSSRVARTMPSAMIIDGAQRSPSARSLLLEQAVRGAIAVLLGHRAENDMVGRRAPVRSRPAPGARRARGGSRRSW